MPQSRRLLQDFALSGRNNSRICMQIARPETIRQGSLTNGNARLAILDFRMTLPLSDLHGNCPFASNVPRPQCLKPASGFVVILVKLGMNSLGSRPPKGEKKRTKPDITFLKEIKVREREKDYTTALKKFRRESETPFKRKEESGSM